MVAAWADWANRRVQAAANASPRDASAMRRVPHRFDIAAHSALAQFDAGIAALGEGLQSADATEDYVRRLENQQDDFRGLLGVILQASAREGVETAVLGRGLDYYLVDAAARAAGVAGDAQDARRQTPAHPEGASACSRRHCSDRW